ncbi:Box C/D snoRNA accumulation, variant 2 [Ascochyta rabiei]|uniref:Box C/D snoRNA protein 1 n=1 Tax=Didymella rabiei TaxID=5454 RepID=A0A163D0B6_DIDRA|nr:Box C/D snoRNA accumulation, variant 2 [Ascochyta rabiei]KZM22822.1 hypothetical protein ST47_g6034 [Ascochyta rabiei]UPX10960.1 Box C/D snoRNA accumulation, variant 2 [Ascochyta rabiei]
MSGQTLLSSLCSVCNIKESKYKCPGCSARTCSLPCVKRHKQWAQCSGKRDPTKYVKKSQLATPAGIDHDYNFLSGIERDLEKSEKSVAERGLHVGLSARPKGDQTQRMDYQLAAAGVKVIRAPKGMSRARENKTHRSKSGNKNIIWTVEWIGEDKSRTLTQSSAVEPIYRAHPLFESTLSKKKRKRGAEVPSNSESELPQHAAEPTNDQATLPQSESIAETQKPSPPMPKSLAQEAQEMSDTHAEAPPPDPAQSDTPTDGRYSFFLLRPRTSSSRRVLIPLTSSDTLGEALRGCTVEEFPTIYFFSSTTPNLPAEFVLDEDYRMEEGEQQREFEELMKDVDPAILKKLRDDGTSGRADEEVDSRKILDVLKQDLGVL